MTNAECAQEFEVVSDLSHHCYFNPPDLTDLRSKPEIPHGRRGADPVERACRQCDMPFLTVQPAAKFCLGCREMRKHRPWPRAKKRFSRAFRQRLMKLELTA